MLHSWMSTSPSSRATTGTAADRTKASEQAMTDHPELWAFYQRARMGID